MLKLEAEDLQFLRESLTAASCCYAQVATSTRYHILAENSTV